jgi:hypothetical protein
MNASIEDTPARKATKIIATLGPASAPRIADLLAAGVDVFRINFSHGDEAQRDLYLNEIRRAEKRLGRPVAVCADLCGPKIRAGMIEGGAAHLETGQEVTIQRHAGAAPLLALRCATDRLLGLALGGRKSFAAVRATPFHHKGVVAPRRAGM